jgi:hypothetical protein
MFFTVLPILARVPPDAHLAAFLITDNWDDAGVNGCGPK